MRVIINLLYHEQLIDARMMHLSAGQYPTRTIPIEIDNLIDSRIQADRDLRPRKNKKPRKR